MVRALSRVLLLLLPGCVQSGLSSLPPAALPNAANQSSSVQQDIVGPGRLQSNSPIRHIVVVVQENRSVDNLFNGLPGADTVRSGHNSYGKTIALRPELLTAGYDMTHTHASYEVEYNGGSMNGFDRVSSKCGRKDRSCPPSAIRAYAYVPQSDVQPYFDMAKEYTFADQMFESNQGPSFPAHQYLVSGTSAINDHSTLRSSENPRTRQGTQTGGCDSPPGTRGELINGEGREDVYTFPCFDRTALPDLIDRAGLSWHYYAESKGAGLWTGLDAIRHIWQNRGEYDANVIAPSATFLHDVAGGYLADVTWITPSPKASDHPLLTNGTGPSWVASVVSAVGTTPFWDSTAIIVVWDDWGGWYDHVPPHQYNSYELGMRVPMLVISPYAKRGYVSHVHYEFASILKFIEQTFNLGSMGTTDKRAAGLDDCFDFGSKPNPYAQIKAPYSAQYFLSQPPTDELPDTD